VTKSIRLASHEFYFLFCVVSLILFSCVSAHILGMLIVYEYAAHMKDLRALQNTLHCMKTKSFARLSHEEVYASMYPVHIAVNIIYIYIYINMCFDVLFFRQAVKGDTLPTRAKSYITTHTKKNESYPNDIVNERCVCYSHFLYCFTYVCDNLFTINICLTH